MKTDKTWFILAYLSGFATGLVIGAIIIKNFFI
jgi:hypothetical protein